MCIYDYILFLFYYVLKTAVFFVLITLVVEHLRLHLLCVELGTDFPM